MVLLGGAGSSARVVRSNDSDTEEILMNLGKMPKNWSIVDNH